jgi:hypothetical protein
MNKLGPDKFKVRINDIKDPDIRKAIDNLRAINDSYWREKQQSAKSVESALSTKIGLPTNAYVDEKSDTVVVTPSLSQISSEIRQSLSKMPSVLAVEPVDLAKPF